MSISTTLHGVQSITAAKTTCLGIAPYGISYYRALKVVTDEGETFELVMFSPDPNSLSLIEDENLR